MKNYDDKRYFGMLDTSYEASKSPIRVVAGVHRPDKHPNEGSLRTRFRAPQTQEIHGKSNISPHAFKLRYLCDYWELEAEIKTGERFRFVIYFNKTRFTILDSQQDWIESGLARTIQY